MRSIIITKYNNQKISGIKNVFISNVDPDPRTSGKGIKKLIDSGINVVAGLLEKEGELINSGFFSRIN